jgi:type II secretory pathway pseudopilin PulG
MARRSLERATDRLRCGRPLAGDGADRHAFADGRGFGLIEILAFMALFAILLAAGLPHVDNRRQNINLALRQVAADVRWTRARALGSGAHFALRVTGSNRYQIERLELAAGNWQLAEVVRHTTLPQTIAIEDFTPNAIEFDTRGTVVFAAETTPGPWMPRLVDETFGAERAFAIWPSGQFHELP